MPSRIARVLRRKPTEEERILWSELRKSRLGGFRFRRQHPIGPYVADFVCLERRFVVEVDGIQHGFVQNQGHELERTRFLEATGFKVFRVWNGEVRENLVGVCDSLLSELEQNPERRRVRRHPTPTLPLRGGGRESE